MAVPTLQRLSNGDVTLLGDARRPGGVAFGFTERTGGVSQAPFASLNLGDACGDDPLAVAENRRRALAALCPEADPALLVNPRQVHGDHVVRVTSAAPEAVRTAQAKAREGSDAVVCTAPGVPVLLCFADCVPVVITCEGGFAVAHSGWRGTIARIAALSVRALAEATGAAPQDMRAYIGPHIAGADYEVSEELLERFEAAFGSAACASERHLDLAACVRRTLEEAGLTPQSICDAGVSTPRATERFYSYRAEGGRCGRHGALAVLQKKGE